MRSLTLLPLAALAFTLSACGGTQNRGLESVHQPVVSRTNYVYDVPDNGGMQNARDIQAWLDSINLGYGDRVAVDDPSRNPGNATAIAAITARYGLIVEDTAPVTQGAIAPGTFRVVVTRAKAEVPGCPDWSRSSVGNFEGDTPSNFGCAINSNLAAMIANPDDLISGAKADTLNDNSRGTAAIRKLKSPPAK